MELKLLKFSADWCGPCKMQKEELIKNPVGIDVQEIDIDSIIPKEIELIHKYKIMSIPNMVIIGNDGEVKSRFVGFTTSDKIKEAIAKIQEESKERFVVIEDFNGYISLVANPDTGDTLVFDTYKEAEAEAKECQNGHIVKL